LQHLGDAAVWQRADVVGSDGVDQLRRFLLAGLRGLELAPDTVTTISPTSCASDLGGWLASFAVCAKAVADNTRPSADAVAVRVPPRNAARTPAPTL
jgi:hypothetical protein